MIATWLKRIAIGFAIVLVALVAACVLLGLCTLVVALFVLLVGML